MRPITALIAAGLTLVPAMAFSEKPAAAVPEVQARGVAQSLVAGLTRALRATVSADGTYRVVEPRANLAELRLVLDCEAATPSCWQALAQSLKVQVLFLVEVRRSGYDEALLLDGDGFVACGPWVGTVPGIQGGGDCDPADADTFPGAAPKDAKPGSSRGSSEIVPGRLRTGRTFLAAIEPWHGDQVAVYAPDPASPGFTATAWRRQVLDDTLSEGHVLVAADFDGDGDEEIVAGWRGAGGGLTVEPGAAPPRPGGVPGRALARPHRDPGDRGAGRRGAAGEAVPVRAVLRAGFREPRVAD